MYYSPWPTVKFCYSEVKPLDFCPKTCHTNSMRKIETQMNTAIRTGKNWSMDNTTVTYDDQTVTTLVRLHGNLIAEVTASAVKLFDGGWQTVTTKSRLNAILSGLNKSQRVHQEKGQWYIWSGLQDDTSIPFSSGTVIW